MICVICGEMGRLEGRFGYVVCSRHEHIPPNQIHKYRKTVWLTVILQSTPIEIKHALVPSYLIDTDMLAQVDNKIVNCDPLTDEQEQFIMTLIGRLGFEYSGPNEPDLQQYVEPEPPFYVHTHRTIGWLI